MPLVTINDLITPETEDEFAAEWLTILANLGFPTTSWAKDNPTLVTISAGARVFAERNASVTVPIAESGFLDFSSGAWLTFVAKYTYGVDRIDAEEASGSEVLTNGSAINYVVNPGDLTFAKADGTTYTNTTGGSLLASGTLSVTMQATIAGSSGSAAIGEVSMLVTPLLGVTVSNPAAIVGLDEESDDSLRERAREQSATLSPNGTAAAYVFFAKLAPDSTTGQLIGITRVGKAADVGDGTVLLYVATPTGPATTGQAEDVQTFLYTKCVPDRTTLDVDPATTYTFAPTISVYTTDASLTSGEVSAAIVAYLSVVPIGGVLIAGVQKLPLSGVVHAISALSGVKDVRIAVPTGDPTLLLSDVPVLGSATITMHVVA